MMCQQFLMLFALNVMLFSIIACQETDESIVTETRNNDFECVVKIHDMSDGTDTSLSKKVRDPKPKFLSESGTVFLYNFDTDTCDIPYHTLILSNKSGTLKQEWLLSDLCEDWFDEAIEIPNVDGGTKSDFFYKWHGNIFDMYPGTWDEYIRNEKGHEEKGFHIVNVIDLQKLKEIVGDFSDGCDMIHIKADGMYSYCPNLFNSNKGYVCWWLFPINSTYNYYGMAANSHSNCGVFARIAPGKDSFEEMYTNSEDLYIHIRLVRDMSTKQ